MIPPRRRNRTRPHVQDARRPPRYDRRLLVGRLVAWLQWQRRLLGRREYYAENFLGFVELPTITVLLKKFSDRFCSPRLNRPGFSGDSNL